MPRCDQVFRVAICSDLDLRVLWRKVLELARDFLLRRFGWGCACDLVGELQECPAQGRRNATTDLGREWARRTTAAISI